MKRLAIASLCALLAGCGNWSNADLVFLHALPSKQALEAKVPDAEGSSQSGLSSRKDGLAVGQRSRLYEKTQGGADTFNNGLLNILNVVELVKQHPPSARTPNSRTWGPWDDKENPGRNVRLVITRKDEESGTRFEWTIDAQKHGENDWLSVVSGYYLPSVDDDIRKGAGVVALDAARVRNAGFAGKNDDGKLQRLEARYATDGDPVRVELDLSSMGGSFLDPQPVTLHYESERAADGSGFIRFDLVADLMPSLADKSETLTVRSKWLSSGAGRADVKVSGGDLAGDLEGGAECWDEAFVTVYGEEKNDFDIDENGQKNEFDGDPSRCAL